MEQQATEATGASKVVRTVLLLVGALVAAWFAGLAFAAFAYMAGTAVESGEETDWGSQPLEVFVDSTEACVLNVGGVAPGRHDVTVFAEGSPGRVRIEDPDGRVVFRAVARPSEEAVRPRVVLLRRLGVHRVECRVGDVVTTASLRVAWADELAEQ